MYLKDKNYLSTREYGLIRGRMELSKDKPCLDKNAEMVKLRTLIQDSLVKKLLEYSHWTGYLKLYRISKAIYCHMLASIEIVVALWWAYYQLKNRESNIGEKN